MNMLLFPEIRIQCPGLHPNADKKNFFPPEKRTALPIPFTGYRHDVCAVYEKKPRKLPVFPEQSQNLCKKKCFHSS